MTSPTVHVAPRPNSRERARKRAAVRRRDGLLCNWCKKAWGTTLDHVLPRSRGGSNEIRNLVLACVACNQARGNGPKDD